MIPVFANWMPMQLSCYLPRQSWQQATRVAILQHVTLHFRVIWIRFAYISREKQRPTIKTDSEYLVHVNQITQFALSSDSANTPQNIRQLIFQFSPYPE